MLPAAYQLPAAGVLLVGGLVASFFGYRLFKFVLAIFGFIVGALAASSIWGASNTTYMVIAAIVGGMAGSLLLLAAYFVGVALVGAALGALIANLIWTQIEGDPHPFVVVLFSVAGALLATWLQRYVIILGTSFGGAWTILVGVARHDGRPDGAERRGRRRHLGRVSDEPGARSALGALRVDRARPGRHVRADVRDRRPERARGQAESKKKPAA